MLFPRTCTDNSQIQAQQKKSAAPNTQEYVTAGGEEVIKVLQSAAELVPVPLLSNVLGVAIKVIEMCKVKFQYPTSNT